MTEEFKIAISESAVTDLMLGRCPVLLEVDGLRGKYKLEDLSSMTVKIEVPTPDERKRTYTLYCRASKGAFEYRAKLIVSKADNGPYQGAISFLEKHV